jgi:hypothetical protein
MLWDAVSTHLELLLASDPSERAAKPLTDAHEAAFLIQVEYTRNIEAPLSIELLKLFKTLSKKHHSTYIACTNQVEEMLPR